MGFLAKDSISLRKRFKRGAVAPVRGRAANYGYTKHVRRKRHAPITPSMLLSLYTRQVVRHKNGVRLYCIGFSTKKVDNLKKIPRKNLRSSLWRSH